jgi:hypothetical protein
MTPMIWLIWIEEASIAFTEFTVACSMRSVSPASAWVWEMIARASAERRAVCLTVAVISSSAAAVSSRFAAWVSVVLAFYFLWGRHHSALNHSHASAMADPAVDAP